MMISKLLIVDDEENMRLMLKSMLSRHGFEIDLAENGRQALLMVEATVYNFILCDVKMPDMDGMGFLRKAKAALAQSTVIMMSAYGSIDLALEAMKCGAYDFVSKPFKTDEVVLALKKAEERELLRRENRELKEKLRNLSGDADFPGMVGSSKVMEVMFQFAAKIAVYDTTVLITGESGTGKELLAKGIHQLSQRRRKEFFAINCAGIPESLIESELFGFSKGAFTGADKGRDGLFVQADGATLFLDEIGELPLSAQVKLLRVLQEREVRPIGANKTVYVDVRILAATSRDMVVEVERGRFREDLLYRLNVVELKLPPLRERKSDIKLLANTLLKKKNVKLSKDIDGFSEESIEILNNYSWPGNVRELENVIERAVILASKEIIEPSDLSISSNGEEKTCMMYSQDAGGFSLKRARKVMEAQFIRRALIFTEGNKSQAADLLEVSYPSLLSKIKEYDIVL